MSEPKEEQLDPQIYKRLVQNLQKIEAINLKSLTISNVNHNLDGNLAVDLSYDFGDHIIEDDYFSVCTNFFIKAYCKEEQNNIAFQIEFELSISYLIKDLKLFDEQYIDMYKKINVPLHVWPYARELVSSLTTRMGFSPLVVEPIVISR